MTRSLLGRARAGLLVLLTASACTGPEPEEQARSAPPPASRAATGAKPGEVLAEPEGLPSFAEMIERVSPTVVGVTTRRTASGPSAEEPGGQGPGAPGPGAPGPHAQGPGAPGPGDSPFAPAPQLAPRVVTGVGSGFIIDPKGLVLTSNHVVAGATEVLVRTAEHREYAARVIGRDPETDVALLRLQDVEGRLPAARLGDSDALRVGDWVLAIGSPFGLALTVTNGIVSAKERVIGAGPYDDFVQTNAAINPGSSGGPLFNLNGEAVGINTALVAHGQGIGFAVPINAVKAMLPQLEKDGRVVRSYLGVIAQDLTPELAEALKVTEKSGALVASVAPGSPASKAGLRPEDLVVALDEERIEGANDLIRRVAVLRPGHRVKLRFLRHGSSQETHVAVAERPGQPPPPPGAPAAPGGAAAEASLGLSLQPVPPTARRQLGVAEGALVTAVEPGAR
ncbi:MAG TPA: trypsin-like peptidase domain-containing protein, partial [Polyangia bacterium]